MTKVLVFLSTFFFASVSFAQDTYLCASGLSGRKNCSTPLQQNLGGLGVSSASATQNFAYVGPGSGGAGAATFRLLVPLDIPSLDAVKITTGIFDNNRINWASPFAIGSTTPAAVTGTAITATSGFFGPGDSISGLGIDLSGTLALANVVGFRGRPVSATAPTGTDQAYVWNGTSWLPISVVLANGSGTNAITCTFSTAVSALQAVKRLNNGLCAAATGGTASDGDLVIGVAPAAVLAAASGLVVKNGGYISTGALTSGKVFRSNTAAVVPYGTLTSLDYSNMIGVASTVGLDVNVSEGFQVP